MDKLELEKLAQKAKKITKNLFWDSIKDPLYKKGQYVSEFIVDIVEEYIKLPQGNKKDNSEFDLNVKLVPFDDYPSYENKPTSLFTKESLLKDLEEKGAVKNWATEIKQVGIDSTAETSYEYFFAKITCTIKIFEFLKEILEKIQKELTPTLIFDETRSMLLIGKEKVNIRKFSDQYHLLKTIFNNKNLSEEFFFSKIAENLDFSNPVPDKKYYNAVFQIKTKLEKLGINDLFITTNQSVTINPKYLS